MTTRQLKQLAAWSVGVLVTIVAVYGLLSAAIAIATVDDCGDENADKHWSFFPPEWVCD